MSPEIVSIGEPMLEFNATEAGSLRQIRHYEVGYGGDSSNVAVAATRLGATAGYICRLGDDDFGRIFLDLWQAEGVDAGRVICEAGASTGIYFISRKGTEHFFTYYRKDSAASHLSKADIPEGYIKGAKILHTSGISQAISNSACDAAFHAMEVAKSAGVMISYDTNLRLQLWDVGRARAVIWESIRMSDFVLPSLEDAKFITGMTDPEAIASRLFELGPKAVALKLGGEGVLLATEDGLQRFEPYAVEVVDTTGAGDTFDGGFMAAYLRGQSLPDCTIFANAAAALSTTGWGAVGPVPRRDEVEAFLKKSSI